MSLDNGCTYVNSVSPNLLPDPPIRDFFQDRQPRRLREGRESKYHRRRGRDEDRNFGVPAATSCHIHGCDEPEQLYGGALEHSR